MQKRIPAVIFLIFVVFFLLFLIIFKANHKNSALIPTPPPVNYSTFGIFKNVYEIRIPTNWTNISNSNGQAVILPGKNGVSLGNISEITITTNNDSTKSMSSQEEFDQWYEKSRKEVSKSALQKQNNTNIDGEKALALVDNSIRRRLPDAWSIVYWVRKDDTNYYINFIGRGVITSQDNAVINYIIKSFKFSSN